MYNVAVPHSVAKQIKKLPQQVIKRVLKEIDGLGNNPRPLHYKKLIGEDLFRIRVGDYRVIYAIDDTQRCVVIVRVGHRREVYR
jgi:mRNA interferase RelE/StbE